MVDFRRSILALVFVLAGASAALAQDQQNNHTAAFLRYGVDARHLALGGAGVALADNVSAGYWNPAGLALLRGFSFTGMTASQMNFDRHSSYVAGAWGSERVAFGLSWLNAGTENIPGADASGRSTGDFSFNENAIIASIATQAGNANLGLSLKLLSQSLGTTAPAGGDDNAVGFGIDVGTQIFVTQFARIGFALYDIFGEVGENDTDTVNDIPSNLRFGLALEPMDGLVLTGDLEKERDVKKYKFRGGIEYGAPLGNDLSAAVRLGLRGTDYSGGLGIQYGVFRFDYAYVIEPEAFLDESHRFSFGLDFGTRRHLIREGVFADTDNDGIPDDLDACPGAAEDYDGYEDFDGCPELDNDLDGVPDQDDGCPDEAEDFDGYMDSDGCPDPDNDGDGIPDANDGCPDEPETVNGFEDDDGCPDQVSVTFPPAFLNFLPGSAEIPPGSHPVLDDVLRRLQEMPELELEIQGHTDSDGSASANLQLSRRRAESVMQYFVDGGIAPGRLRVRGIGEAQPVASNDTVQGRGRNRRIEFVSLNP